MYKSTARHIFFGSKQQVALPRRAILTSGAAALALGFTAPVSLAGVGTESDRASLEHTRRLDAVRYSQADFLKLSQKELTYLYNYRIDGFLDDMASNLVKMMLSDHTSARQLIQEMAQLETDGLRKQRLTVEVARVTALTETLNQSVKRLKAAGKKTALLDEKRLLARAKVYKRGAKTWLKYPREGTEKQTSSGAWQW